MLLLAAAVPSPAATLQRSALHPATCFPRADTLSRCTLRIDRALLELKRIELPPEASDRMAAALDEVEAALVPLQKLQPTLRTYPQISSGLWRAQRENAELRAQLQLTRGAAAPAHRAPPAPPANSAIRESGSPAYVSALAEIRKLQRRIDAQEHALAEKNRQIVALDDWSKALISRETFKPDGSAHGGAPSIPPIPQF